MSDPTKDYVTGYYGGPNGSLAGLWGHQDRMADERRERENTARLYEVKKPVSPITQTTNSTSAFDIFSSNTAAPRTSTPSYTATYSGGSLTSSKTPSTLDIFGQVILTIAFITFLSVILDSCTNTNQQTSKSTRSNNWPTQTSSASNTGTKSSNRTIPYGGCRLSSGSISSDKFLCSLLDGEHSKIEFEANTYNILMN